ncbi:hypothetical protein ACLEDA_08670 [Lonsdalea quercina]
MFDYHDLLKRLEYLTKVDSKVFGKVNGILDVVRFNYLTRPCYTH